MPLTTWLRAAAPDAGEEFRTVVDVVAAVVVVGLDELEPHAAARRPPPRSAAVTQPAPQGRRPAVALRASAFTQHLLVHLGDYPVHPKPSEPVVTCRPQPGNIGTVPRVPKREGVMPSKRVTPAGMISA
jgi:hypothetical protein